MRTLIEQDPFVPANQEKPWMQRGLWPCAWIACPGAGSPPFVTAFRRSFPLARPARVRIHVAADERYDLYLDGTWIGRGSERGAPDVWFYETYDLDLSAGEHLLVARVWSLGERAAEAQMSVHPGFLLAAEGEWLEVLGTGVAAWEAALLPGIDFLPPGPARWRGARVEVDGSRFQWGYERGQGEGWRPAARLKPAIGRLSSWEIHAEHILRPATLPPLLDRPVGGGRVRFAGEIANFETEAVPVRAADHQPGAAAGWQRLIAGQAPLTLEPGTFQRVIVDLEEYFTAYPSFTASGGKGSTLRIHWAESLFGPADTGTWFRPKGNRGEIEGKFFIGYGDLFHLEGGAQRAYDTLWWQAGRYLELAVQVGEEPLLLEALRLRETRYPLEMESDFSASDSRLKAITPLLVRGMQMCSNETFFDCPYYEELQYAGDTRLECLVTYCMTRDARLPRKALRMFDASRLASGLTQSRYPSRVMQIIAPFGLWWVMMVRDYAYWRDDLPFVRSIMPGVRATLDAFERFTHADGLLYGPEGWNTFDWVPAWDADAGVPPDGHSGASGPLNWQLVYTLLQGADLEQRLGESLLAQYCRGRAVKLAQAATRAFWDEPRGMFADDLAHQHFSEHAQCMALLSEFLLPGLLDPRIAERAAEGLLSAPDLSRATIYFSHYLFETYRHLGRVDRLLERLGLWDQLLALDFKTPVEMPEPSRSDCHAWGSHPLFHFFATVLGIRPAGLGFHRVVITPQLGPLEHAEGVLVHPGGEPGGSGEISAAFHRQGQRLHCRVILPVGVEGSLVVSGKTIPISAGVNEIVM